MRTPKPKNQALYTIARLENADYEGKLIRNIKNIKNKNIFKNRIRTRNVRYARKKGK